MLNRENPIVVRLYETEMPYLLSTYYRDGVPQQEITLEDVLEVNRMLENWDDWDEWSEWHWYPMDSVPRLLAALNLKVARGLAAPDEVLRRCALQVVRFGAVHVEPHWADAAGIEDALALCEDGVAIEDLAYVHTTLAQVHGAQGDLGKTARHLRSADQYAAKALLETTSIAVWDRAVLLLRVGQGAEACGESLRALDHFEEACEVFVAQDEGDGPRLRTERHVQLLRTLADARERLGMWAEALAAREEVVRLLMSELLDAKGGQENLACALLECGTAAKSAGHDDRAREVLLDAVEVLMGEARLGDRGLSCLNSALSALDDIASAESATVDALEPDLAEARARASAAVGMATDAATDAEQLWVQARFWADAERRADVSDHGTEFLVTLLNTAPTAVEMLRDAASRRLKGGGTVPEDALYEPGQGNSAAWYALQLDFHNAVRALQVVGTHVCANRKTLKGCSEFSAPNIQREWFAGLDAVLRRTAQCPSSGPGIWWQPGPVPPADDPSGPGAVDGYLHICESRGSCTDLNAANAIRDALTLLLVIARNDKPRLRRCTMPKGLKSHLDFLNGERETDVPECGTFYIAERDGKTCGRSTCKKSNGVLQGHHDGFVKKARKARLAEKQSQRERREEGKAKR